jgi:hypothetical protein
VSELYRPSDFRLSAKLVPTFADGWCRVVSATDPYCSIRNFLDPSRYFFFQVDFQLYARGWVDPVPDPLLLRNSQKLWPLNHRGGLNLDIIYLIYFECKLYTALNLNHSPTTLRLHSLRDITSCGTRPKKLNTTSLADGCQGVICLW